MSIFPVIKTDPVAVSTDDFVEIPLEELLTGIIPSARVAGPYEGITGLGALAQDLLFVDQVVDIGRFDSFRPRNGYFSGVITATGGFIGNLTGRSDSAVKLDIARTIDGIPFDGTTNITLTHAAADLTGTVLPATILNSSLQSFGILNADLLFLDATYDIGKTGATRPRDGFFSRNVTAGGMLSVTGGVAGTNVVAQFGAVALPSAGLTLLNTRNAVAVTPDTNTNVARGSMFVMQGYGVGPLLLGACAGGTVTAPTALGASFNYMALNGYGYDGTTYTLGGDVVWRTTEAWTATAHGMLLRFDTTPNGTVSNVTALTLDQDQSAIFGRHILSAVDSTNDIGASGGNRFRDLYLGRNIVAGTDPGGTEAIRASGFRWGTNLNFRQGGLVDNGTSARINIKGVGDVIIFNTSSQVNINVDAIFTGHVLALTDATTDIGASGANRFRDLFMSRNMVVGGFGYFSGADATSGWLLSPDTTFGLGAMIVRAGAAARFNMITANGTLAAPTIITNGTSLGNFFFNGFMSGSTYRSSAGFNATATENWVSNTSAGTKLTLYVTTNGTAGFTNALDLNHDKSATHYGSVLASTDAAFDIGASGANRFRDMYLSRNAVVGTQMQIGQTPLPGDWSQYAMKVWAQAGVGQGIVLAGSSNWYTISVGGGTLASPLPPGANNNLASWAAGGYDTGGTLHTISGRILFRTINAWSNTDQGSNVAFQLTPSGSTTSSVTFTHVFDTVNATFYTNFIAGTDATYDIGASGANRFRDLFLSRNIVVGGTITASGVIRNDSISTGFGMGGPAGVQRIQWDSVLGGFNLLNAGGAYAALGAAAATFNGSVTSFVDASFDIGASGANRFRDLFLSRNAILAGSLQFSADSSLPAGSVAYITKASGNINHNVASGSSHAWRINGTSYVAITSAIMTIALPFSTGGSCEFVHTGSERGFRAVNTDTSSTALTEIQFVRNVSEVGQISTTNVATSYITSSDMRLKEHLGFARSTDVLKMLVVHDFAWKIDGTRDRGLFAQEAAQVLGINPHAVVQPENEDSGVWGVDYSKFVPDLIVGWQEHDEEITSLKQEVAALKRRLGADEPITRLQ